MYIATNDTELASERVISVLPSAIRRYLSNISLAEASELRFNIGKPFVMNFSDGCYYLNAKGMLTRNSSGCIIINAQMLTELLERLTKSSVYSVKDEIKNGYITIEGGHRAGLAGTAVTENGEVDFIKNISAVNIRLANEIKDAAEGVIDRVMCGGEIKNTLIISPPGAGKTTLLRDLARRISYGGHMVSIADERCEIAAMSRGHSAFDLGPNTSVLDNCRKDKAMLMLLRSMSPEVIVTDEIGSEKDVFAIERIINSGVAVAASVHARDERQLKNRASLKNLLPFFDITIVLSKRMGPGTIERITENA